MPERRSFPRKEYLQPSELKGIFVPTVTPFKMFNDEIKLDVASHIRQITRLAHPMSGVSGIFLASNAGQGRDMEMDDLKLSIFSGIQAVRSVNKELPVVVGALRKNINEVLEVIKFAKESRADAIVLAPGYTQGDMKDILSVVSENTDLPIIIYNNPGFQKKTNLPMEFIRESIKYPEVIGIKDTSGEFGDLKYFEELLSIFKSYNRQVMQGDTKAGLNESIRQADGMVPVQANLYPEILAGIFNKNQPYDNTELRKVLNSINVNKGNYGGTIGLIIHVLVEQGIFETELTYPKVD